MQIKIIIGTVAFMLTMILLGFYSLLEPARMENFTQARLGRQTEIGAEIFADNCASCHGINGMGTNGGECYDATGDAIACQGRQLNNRNLLCGDVSRRMEEREWSGASKFGFIHDTINSGRNSVMVAWGQEYGGPLQENSVNNVTLFVLNWETEEMCDFIPVVFPWPGVDDNFENDPNNEFLAISEITEELVLEANPDATEDIAFELPGVYPGDAANGERLYLEVYSCNACHGNPADAGSEVNAPWHGDYEQNAANRVEGLSAEGYTYQSIMNPDAFYVEGFNALMQSYADQMGQNGPQDLLDIMTFLLDK